MIPHWQRVMNDIFELYESETVCLDLDHKFKIAIELASKFNGTAADLHLKKIEERERWERVQQQIDDLHQTDRLKTREINMLTVENRRQRAALQEALDAYEAHEDHRIAPVLTKALKGGDVS